MAETKKKKDLYTKPKLRERLKEEIKAGDKGGKKGQWSARKSQLLVKAYEKAGGGYRGEKTGKQRDLERWTAEEWQTKEGRARARSAGETKRYLPKKAWERMSESEKRETDTKKRKASRQGQQFVANTQPARAARRSAKKLPIEGYEDLNVRDITGRLAELSAADLKRLRAYEDDHKGRKTVLQAIDRRL